ncbi:MAG: hypothetical protein Ct9H300mP1_09850 [Planctomycetaceae bacterium]|nr:MAG: hypothetical protein Ct9H300mP1_09850 [Planctomycetaceae bacterium]
MLLRQDREGIAETVGPENASGGGLQNRRVGRRRDLLRRRTVSRPASPGTRATTSPDATNIHWQACWPRPRSGAETTVNDCISIDSASAVTSGCNWKWAVDTCSANTPSFGQVPAVNRKGLLGQQVDRHRVAGKGIQDQHVEPLGLLPLEAQRASPITTSRSTPRRRADSR